jgi:RNA ligase
MLELLNKYHNDGLLYKQTHPTLPLTIWNYTEKVQYEGLWDEVTLMCRGLVTDSEGTIIARPFRKFFNMEEGKHAPTSEFEVYEKMDGSLGIFFYYEGNPVFATRGSFTSDQAIKGREILNKYNWQYGTYEGYTYLFEIIYPENRVVVNYNGLEELIVLGVIETSTGKECKYSEMENEGFVLVKKYDGIKNYSTLKSLISNDAEGFVVRFSNGDRMKIKGEEYLRLHKIMTNLSTTAIWELVSSGGNIDNILKDVPDEFYKKVKMYVSSLNYGYYQYWNQLGKTYDYFRFGKYGDIEVEPTKKEFAEHIKDHHPIAKSIMFAMWDDKDYDKIIWKALKPKFEKL